MNDDLPQSDATVPAPSTDPAVPSAQPSDPMNSVSGTLPIHENQAAAPDPATSPAIPVAAPTYSAEPPLMVTAEQVAEPVALAAEAPSYHEAQTVPINTPVRTEPTSPVPLPVTTSAPVTPPEEPVKSEPTVSERPAPLTSHLSPSAAEENGNAAQDSVLGVVGEVLGSTGLVLFVLLLLGPLYKNLVGAPTWEALSMIGLLTSLILLGLGFILGLFLRGRVLFKVLIIIFALIAAVFYFGLFGSATISDQLSGLFGPLLNLYR